MQMHSSMSVVVQSYCVPYVSHCSLDELHRQHGVCVSEIIYILAVASMKS